MELQEAQHHERDAVTAEPPSIHFRKSTLLQELLYDHDKRPDSRLLFKPAIHKLGRLQTIGLIDRYVYVKLTIWAHELDDRHFCTRKYLNMNCQLVRAKAGSHFAESDLARHVIHHI